MEGNPYQAPRSVGDDEVVVALPVDGVRCCDQCGGNDFVIGRWTHPARLHWIINPGLAFNELVLGQRIAASTLTCRRCLNGGWQTQAVYVECPSCLAFHRNDALEYGFGKWGGFVCPDCGRSIPCSRNATALLVLVSLSPIWWPLSWWLKPAYRRWTQQRAQRGRIFSYKQRPAHVAVQQVHQPPQAMS